MNPGNRSIEAMHPDPMAPLVDAIAARVAALLAPQLQNNQGVRPRLLTAQQAAVYLGRTEKAVYALKSRGALPVVQADGRVMFDVQDLDAWVIQNKIS